MCHLIEDCDDHFSSVRRLRKCFERDVMMKTFLNGFFLKGELKFFTITATMCLNRRKLSGRKSHVLNRRNRLSSFL